MMLALSNIVCTNQVVWYKVLQPHLMRSNHVASQLALGVSLYSLLSQPGELAGLGVATVGSVFPDDSSMDAPSYEEVAANLGLVAMERPLCGSWCVCVCVCV